MLLPAFFSLILMNLSLTPGALALFSVALISRHFGSSHPSSFSSDTCVPYVVGASSPFPEMVVSTDPSFGHLPLPPYAALLVFPFSTFCCCALFDEFTLCFGFDVFVEFILSSGSRFLHGSILFRGGLAGTARVPSHTHNYHLSG